MVTIYGVAGRQAAPFCGEEPVMKESKLHEIHAREVEVAFAKSGCTYFPGTKTIAQYRGKRLHEELELLGHSTLAFNKCKCRKQITVPIQQEWNEFYASKLQ